jgi:hypothetical protein
MTGPIPSAISPSDMSPPGTQLSSRRRRSSAKTIRSEGLAGKRWDYTTDFPHEFGKMVDMTHPVPRATLLALFNGPATISDLAFLEQ